MLKDTDTYTSVGAFRLPPVPESLQSRLPDGWPHFGVSSLLNADPPVHTPIRKLANQGLSPRAVAALEPGIRVAAVERLHAIHADGECDFLEAFARPFPVEVLADVLGVDDRCSRDLFPRWADDAFHLANPHLPEHQTVVHGAGLADMRDCLVDVVARRRAQPKDDLISRLIWAEANGAPTLTTSQIISIAIQLLVAGAETTAALISNTVLLTRTRWRDAWDLMREDRDSVPLVIEEILRIKSPARGVVRIATRESTLGGVAVPAGASIFLMLASANVDSEVVDDPKSLVPGRNHGTRNVAFGRGTHFCIGASLARLEAKVAIEELVDRMPDLELAGDQEPEWAPMLFSQGVSELPVVWSSPSR